MSPTNTTEVLRVLDDGSTRWDRVERPVLRAIPLHPDAHLLTPGEYQAYCLGHRGVDAYRTRKVIVWWQIIEQAEILLPRYYRVLTYRPRVSARPGSDLVRELAAALGQRIRHNRVPLASLAGVLARVEVRTVTQDREQRALADVSQYSIIGRVIGRA